MANCTPIDTNPIYLQNNRWMSKVECRFKQIYSAMAKKMQTCDMAEMKEEVCTLWHRELS